MVELRQIANPVILPESVIVASQLVSIPDSVLKQFKDYLGIAYDSEDANLRLLLLTRFREIAQPTSLGINLQVQTWKLSVDIYGCDFVYLPRYNGMNLSFIDFDSDGNVITTPDWDSPSLFNRVDNIALVENVGDVRPERTEFTYTVGWNADQFPLDVLQMVFMECAFRRDFPLGVDERGQRLDAESEAVERARVSWRMITDLSYYV